MMLSVPQACSVQVVKDELEKVLGGSGRGLIEVLAQNTPAVIKEKIRKLVRRADIPADIPTWYLPNTNGSGQHSSFTHI
jgi:hypothetical protein